jgi:hypothetical protein
MDDLTFALLIVGSALVANVVLHFIVHRVARRPMVSAVLGFAGGLAVLAAGETVRFSGSVQAAGAIGVLLLGDIAFYVCASFLFFNFNNAGVSSIRIRILRELANAGRPLSETELLRRYNDHVILMTRLERLTGGGQVLLSGDRYVLRSRGLVVLFRVMRMLKLLVLRRTSEFG